MNSIIISGNIARDIEGHTANNGIESATVTVAVQRSYRNQNGVREADFFRVLTWRSTAEFLEKYATKGQKVIVRGRMQNRHYTAQDGSERNSWELIAEEVELCKRGENGKEEKQKAPSQNADEFEEIADEELPF